MPGVGADSGGVGPSGAAGMTRSASPKLRAYLALVAAGSVAGLGLGSPELVSLVAPFAVYIAVALAVDRAPRVTVTVRPAPDRIVEGDELVVLVELAAGARAERLELELTPGSGALAVRDPRQALLALGPGERLDHSWSLVAERWGVHSVGVITARTRDRFGLVVYELPDVQLGAVAVLPRLEHLRALIDPLELQATAGNRVARRRGEGIELAEVRPFVSGDRVRQINWRVTARRAAPHVTERHPERNADVILFLDTFEHSEGDAGGTLAVAVRACASLVSAYRESRERVGLVSFGGVLDAIGPRLGVSQLYRIIDALLRSEVVFSYVRKDLAVIPTRMLPPKALVIAITPLLDERSIRALVDLRARGFDLALLEIPAEPFVDPGATAASVLAHRRWLLRREAVRSRFIALGVPVAQWHDSDPLQSAVATAAAFRRRSGQPVPR